MLGRKHQEIFITLKLTCLIIKEHTGISAESYMLNVCKLQRCANIHGTQKLLAPEEVRRDTTLGTIKLYSSLMVEGK
jgi:hypothetical protein